MNFQKGDLEKLCDILKEKVREVDSNMDLIKVILKLYKVVKQEIYPAL